MVSKFSAFAEHFALCAMSEIYLPKTTTFLR